MKIFQTKIRFLGHDIFQGTIEPIYRCIEFVDKFLDELQTRPVAKILRLPQLCLGFYPNLKQTLKPLFQRLRNYLVPWSDIHTKVVKEVKSKVKSLPPLNLPNPVAFLIVEIDASSIGYATFFNKDFQTQNLNNSQILFE